MSRRRTSAVVRPDGRVRLRVDLPPAVVELADQLADEAGTDREAVLGDLASVGLPGVLADLARSAVADPAARRLRAVPVDDAGRFLAHDRPGATISIQAERRSTKPTEDAQLVQASLPVQGSFVVASSFLSLADAAAALGVSVPTMRRLCRSGAIPAVRVGAQIRVPADFASALPPATEKVAGS